MADHPSLTHISVALLCAEAGGDPWQIDETLRSGDPGEIAQLSRAFFNAGNCTSEAYGDFVEAQERFRAAWSRENTGEYPINDSAEVQRALNTLTFQRDQLPAVAAKLAAIAAALAEAQRSANREISVLDSELRYLDELIGLALARRQGTSALEDNAISITQNTFDQIRSLRDGYAAELNQALTTLRLDCHYEPAIGDVDGDGVVGPEQRGRDSVDWYNANQQNKDRGLINSRDPITKSAAIARLRDYDAAVNPGTEETARKLARERLDDFRMAGFTGPLPTDPVLGGDARSRANWRLEMQRGLESGAWGLAPMPADQATQELNAGEHLARVYAVQAAIAVLRDHQLSPNGARAVVERITEGGGLITTGLERYGSSVPGGRHAAPGVLSADDARALGRLAGRVGKVGDLTELVLAARDWNDGGSNENLGRSVGKFGGGSAGAWLAGTGAAMVGGPWTAAAVAVGGLILGGKLGESAGGTIGAQFDPPVATATGGRSW